jgi:hypothetical protein
MNQSLFDLGEALEMGQPLGELAPKCLRLLPLYEQYLEALAAASGVGILTRQHRPKPNERRLLAVLWAGSEGAGAQDLRKLLVGESCDARLVISRLLIDCQHRVEELFGLILEKIREAVDADEIDTGEALECIDRPDHQTRLLAVGRFCSLLKVLLKTAMERRKAKEIFFQALGCGVNRPSSSAGQSHECKKATSNPWALNVG